VFTWNTGVATFVTTCIVTYINLCSITWKSRDYTITCNGYAGDINKTTISVFTPNTKRDSIYTSTTNASTTNASNRYHATTNANVSHVYATNACAPTNAYTTNAYTTNAYAATDVYVSNAHFSNESAASAYKAIDNRTIWGMGCRDGGAYSLCATWFCPKVWPSI
jgi:hypothetical protein